MMWSVACLLRCSTGSSSTNSDSGSSTPTTGSWAASGIAASSASEARRPVDVLMTFSSVVPLVAGVLEALHGLERLLHVLDRRDAADRLGDLAVRRHDERRPLCEPVVDVLAARVLHAGTPLADLELVGARDRAALVRCDGELARAIVRIGGEVVQPLDAVERYADHARAGR